MKRIIFPIFLAILCHSAIAQQEDLVLSTYNGETNITALGSITLKPGFHIPYGNTVTLSISDYPNILSQPSAARNYTRTRIFRVSGVNESNVTSIRTVDQENHSVVYRDGLSRPIQEVSVMGSPTFKDMVQHIQYDGLGRETLKYLPYAESASSNGSFKVTARENLLAFYKSTGWDAHVAKTDYPYAATEYDPSILGRVVEQGAPGGPWQPATGGIANSGHTTSFQYGTNAASEVRYWVVTATGASGSGFYSAGTLNKTTVEGENPGSKTDEFSDVEGRVVYKRVWNGGTAIGTYYIYDHFGDLRYIVPPAVTATSFTETDANFKAYIYSYKYDGRRRQIERKIPGKGREYTIYNKNNLPILTQDSVQRLSNKWSYAKYDAFGRVVASGIYTNTAQTTYVQVKALADAISAQWENRVGVANYTNQSFPNESTKMQTYVLNYYDDYTFNGGGTTALKPMAITPSSRTQGLLTGTLITKDDGTGPMLAILYYDDKARLLQSVSQNHLGGTDRVTNTYGFMDEILASKREHTGPSNPTIVLNKYSYDHFGRPLSTRESINSQPEVIQSSLEYNEIGQLKKKRLHSEDNGTQFLLSLDYRYNERGWITSIASPLFSQLLAYESPTGSASPQYNGNISEQQWRHENTEAYRKTSYTYDGLNRLAASTSTGVTMGETLTYDVMGNIKSLKRDAGTTIAYNYSGNQLTSVTGGLTGSYTYDGNGNAKTDRMGFSLGYNYLNLPKTATKAGTSVGYLYNALGGKLRKTATVNGVTTQRDYVAGIEYYTNGTNDLIDIIHTADGYAQKSGNNFAYYYNLRDHLGNIRTVAYKHPTSGKATAVQRTDYYPFGMQKIVLGGTNKYLYNGKELQDELGQYDYGARYYDPAIGRWGVADPLAEMYTSFSPYSYVGNNPIIFTDPTGMYKYDSEGNIVIDEPDQIARFLDYLNNAGGTSTKDMFDYITNGDNGFSLMLDEVVVTAWSNTSWITNAQNQVTNAVNLMSNFDENINFVTTSHFGFEQTKLALDIGGGLYGGFEKAVAPGNQWLGKNGKYYSNSWGGNQHTGSRSGAYKAAGMYKWAGRATVAGGVIVGGVETYRGYQMDGGKFGYNAQLASGKMAGALAGAWLGAKAGSAGGGIVGSAFFGVGAAPGALIGGLSGVIGGFIGGYYGAEWAGQAVNHYHGR